MGNSEKRTDKVQVDHSKSDMRSNIQSGVPGGRDHGFNSAQYRQQPDGAVIYSGNQRNRSKMGEVVLIGAVNILGAVCLMLGIIANLDNIASWILSAVGAVWGIIRCAVIYEAYRIKKIERLEKEDRYNQSRRGKSRRA
jgi:hypothetical protein